MALIVYFTAIIFGGPLWADVFDLDAIQTLALILVMLFGPMILHNYLVSDLGNKWLDIIAERKFMTATWCLLLTAMALYCLNGNNLPLSESRTRNNIVIQFFGYVLVSPVVMLIFSIALDKLGGYRYLARKYIKQAEEERAARTITAPQWVPHVAASSDGNNYDPARFKRDA